MDTLNICECWTCLGLDLISLSNPSLQVHLLGGGVSSEWDVRSAGKSNQRENVRSVLFWRCALNPVEK